MLGLIKHEFIYQIRSFSALASGGLLFGLAFLFTANGIEFQGTVQGQAIFINSPYYIMVLLPMLCVLSVLFMPAFTNHAALRDSEYKIEALIYSKPIGEGHHFWGRFLGSSLAFSCLAFAAPVGMYLGCFWPWVDSAILGPSKPLQYGKAFVEFVLPSLWIMLATMFSVASLSKKSIYGYLAGLGLFFAYLAAINSTFISGLFDPFLLLEIDNQTAYWTAQERNTQWLQWNSTMLMNRGIWVGFGLGLLGLARLKFKFRISSKATKQRYDLETKAKVSIPQLQQVTPTYSIWRSWFELTKSEVLFTIKRPAFLILMVMCLFVLASSLLGRSTNYDVPTYPLTTFMITTIKQSLTFALIVVLAFFSADIIWREKQDRFHEIIGGLPIPNWMFISSKLLALLFLMQSIIFMGIIVAIVHQVTSGFYRIDWSLYLVRAFIFQPLPYLCMAVLTVLFQVMVRHKMLGFLAFGIFTAILSTSRDIFGVEHILWSYGLPGVSAPLSEMNGVGRFMQVGWWARLYWLSLAGVLLVLISKLWDRSHNLSLFQRVKAISWKQKQVWIPLVGSCLVTLFCASNIYRNTHVLNTYRTTDSIEQLSVSYEHLYQNFKELPMPNIVEVAYEVDLFPLKREVATKGKFVLENLSQVDINEVHLVFSVEVEVVHCSIENSHIIETDDGLNFVRFKLDSPLKPQERRVCQFETAISQKGFPNSRPDTRLVRNGTYINDFLIAPKIGLSTDLFVQNPKRRKELGLPALGQMHSGNESPKNHNYVRHDSHFVTYDALVSTDASQIALAPGDLKASWTEGGRRFSHFSTAQPIMNYVSFLSAEYRVKRDSWNEVELEIYYHDDHKYNVERMLQACKDSLDIFSEAFGPYPHKSLRIVEFPAYKESAQSYPGLIPFSEGIGFVADLRDPNTFDLPYYVTAHEVAHQWWAHQAMPAKTPGATMLIESFAQYSALLVMEKTYGKVHIRKFLQKELDKYLRQRNDHALKEQPLAHVENQPFVHYRKGALVLMATKEILGEQTLNKALKEYLTTYTMESLPYPTSHDFLNILKLQANPQQWRMLVDLYLNITFFDLSILSVDWEQNLVKIHFSAGKTYESDQKQMAQEYDFPIEIGGFRRHPSDPLFSKEDILFLKKVNSGDTNLSVPISEKPKWVAIDPFLRWIDRTPQDNIQKP